MFVLALTAVVVLLQWWAWKVSDSCHGWFRRLRFLPTAAFILYWVGMGTLWAMSRAAQNDDYDPIRAMGIISAGDIVSLAFLISLSLCLTTSVVLSAVGSARMRRPRLDAS